MVNALKKMLAALRDFSTVDFRQVAAAITEHLIQDDGERAVREWARRVGRSRATQSDGLGPHCQGP